MPSSTIFGNILATPESASIWSDDTRTKYYLHFEACLARAQGRLGIIPHEAADLISQECSRIKIDWDELRTQTERIGYPVLPVVKQIVQRINDLKTGIGEYAHYGATTQDVTDTTTVLQLRDTLNLAVTSVDNITDALIKLCEKHKTTPMPARSNLQQAVPISFGFKLARLLATFQRHHARLAEVRSRLLVVEFGGAAGTLATLSPNGQDDLGLRCQAELAKELGLGVPEIAWHTERDRIAEAGHWLALVTSTCAKFATDLKLLMQTEVGEASEPYAPERGSSSTMPQKRNPIGCAYICAAAASVRTLQGSLYEAMVADHERSTGPWEIEWIALPQMATLSCAALMHTERLVAGLEVHEERMRENLRISKGTINSEAVMMGLAPTVGRQKAHDLVYGLCREAATGGRPLVDLMDECGEIELEKKELERLCDPQQYLGLSEVMTEKVLAQVREARAIS